MKIDDSFSPSGLHGPQDPRSHSVGQTADTRGAGRPQEGKAANATDSASLSALSVELARAIDREPPETVAKIGRLQEAVANGTYTVPAADVSAKIVASLLKPEAPVV